MKYEKSKYLDSGFYGDFEDEEVKCYKEKLVRCRKEHKCSACQKEITIGTYAICETGFMEGKGVSCYTCTDCIEEWLEESGQVEVEGEEEC